MSSVADLKQAVLVNTLRNCRLFAGLPVDDLRRIAEITRVRRLERGEYLFHEGEPARGFFVVQSGSINIHRLSPAGKEQVIHIFRAGESFAEITLASDAGYPADARALEASQVLLVQKAEFTSLLKQQTELALRMLGSMSQHLRVLVGLLDDLTLKDVETRLANWVVKRGPHPLGDEPFRIELP
ncbi:MAG: Crp/Fnr family transcriptional regulator, partial [Candidatus Omnitrophica bacterium]|nr:Crp/Fnr family transcriptional regulator [Candidatus Omnitrophota bacterium]